MTSQYLVYLRRSIQRRFFRHLSLVLILFIAMTMPLMVSIYRSSALEGVRERVWEFTHGSNFIIRHANEDDLPLFSDIPGLAATFEESNIYLRLVNESETLTREAQQKYSAELLSRMNQSENTALRASNVNSMGMIRACIMRQTKCMLCPGSSRW